jgi:hypothetical protein
MPPFQKKCRGRGYASISKKVAAKQVGCGDVPNMAVFHDDISASYRFSVGSLQINRSILFYFF